jgi:hypothetical protein
MALRFIILFVGLAAIQLLALHFANGFQRIYSPFLYIVEPVVGRLSGNTEGDVLLVGMLTVILGIFVYSAVLAAVGAFLISRGLSKSPSDD